MHAFGCVKCHWAYRLCFTELGWLLEHNWGSLCVKEVRTHTRTRAHTHTQTPTHTRTHTNKEVWLNTQDPDNQTVCKSARTNNSPHECLSWNKSHSMDAIQSHMSHVLLHYSVYFLTFQFEPPEFLKLCQSRCNVLPRLPADLHHCKSDLAAKRKVKLNRKAPGAEDMKG